MNLQGDDIVWAFDGRDGRDGGLTAMLGFYCTHLETLLPPASDDPFEQIVADLADDPTNRMLGNPRLARLFPPALDDDKGSDEFWRDSIHLATRARLASARAVESDIDAFDGFVPVRLDAVDDWAKTLGALRLFWYSEVAGTDRLAEPVESMVHANPGLVDLIEWLGYLLEDLMDSRSACLRDDESLDPDQFQRATPADGGIG